MCFDRPCGSRNTLCHHRYSVDGQESGYFSCNNTCFDARKVDNTEYVETEYENISCFDAPQGMALHRPYTSGQRNVVQKRSNPKRSRSVSEPGTFQFQIETFFSTFTLYGRCWGLPRDDEGLISLLPSVNKYCITRSTQDYAYWETI